MGDVMSGLPSSSYRDYQTDTYSHSRGQIRITGLVWMILNTQAEGDDANSTEKGPQLGFEPSQSLHKNDPIFFMSKKENNPGLV